MKVTVVPIIIGSLGAEGAGKENEGEIQGRIKTIHTTTLFEIG